MCRLAEAESLINEFRKAESKQRGHLCQVCIRYQGDRLTRRSCAGYGRRVKRLDLACEHCIGCSHTLTNYKRDQQVKCVNLSAICCTWSGCIRDIFESNNEVSDAMKQLYLQMDW